MLGTNDLGLKATWRFRFLGYGQPVQSEIGTIFVDLGNQLGMGVIDHHIKDSAHASSAAAIASNAHFVLEHLLGPLNSSYYAGQLIPRQELVFTFVTHSSPDWDGLISLYLCDYLLRHACLPPPGIVKGLVEAADVVDQGMAQMDGKPVRPFLVYLMMMNMIEGWDRCLLRGIDLLQHCITSSGGEFSRHSLLDEFQPPSGFDEYAEALHNDYELFLLDSKKAEQRDVYLPTKDALSRATKAFIFKTPPRCVLHKYWIRETVAPGVLLVPFADTLARSGKVVVSVDPHSGYVLHCLGYELEQLETKKRKSLGTVRKGRPRFEPEYCDNDDPWYDGRGHGFTIVDSPRGGTVLEYEEIIGVLTSLYKKVVQQRGGKGVFDCFISYRREGGSDIAWALKTQLESRGKKVFLDMEGLKEGHFDTQLLTYLERSTNFLLILSRGALDRCRDEKDWVRREIHEALKMNKNIIPVRKEDFVFPPDDALPEELRGLFRNNAIGLSHEYFYASVEKIAKFMS